MLTKRIVVQGTAKKMDVMIQRINPASAIAEYFSM
jgi:hypothetical protein